MDGRGHWLAGQKVILAGEIPQEVYTVNTTHNTSQSFTPSPISPSGYLSTIIGSEFYFNVYPGL